MTKTITLKDILTTQPYNFNPKEHLPEDWTGSIFDWLYDSRFTIEQRIVAATQFPIVTPAVGNLFALWCIDSVKEYLTPKQIEFRNSLENFITGSISSDELDKMWNEAWDYNSYDEEENYGLMLCVIQSFRGALCQQDPGMCAFCDIRDAHKYVGTFQKFETQALEKLIELFREVGDE